MKTRLKKITVALEESLVRWIRIEAARNKLSVSRFLATILEERKQGQDRYDAAMKRALSRKPFAKSKGKYLSREDAHNRDSLRTSPKTKSRPAHAWACRLLEES